MPMITIIFYVTGVVFCISKLVTWIVSKVRGERDRYDRDCDDKRRYSNERDKFLDTFKKRFEDSDEDEQVEILRWLKGKKRKGGEDSE